MSYAVVIFDNDDSVAVVSKEWLKISKSKTACYWPDIRNPKRMERAIINHEQPEDDWVSYTVKVKYETDSYICAMDKSRTAEMTDTILTDIDDRGKPIRRKLKTQRYTKEEDVPKSRKPEGTIYRRPSPIQFDMFDTGNISLDSDADSSEGKDSDDTIQEYTRNESQNELTSHESASKLPRKSHQKSSSQHAAPSSATPSTSEIRLNSTPRRRTNNGIIQQLAEQKTILQEIQTLMSHVKNDIKSIKKSISKEETIKLDFNLPIVNEISLRQLEELVQNAENATAFKRKLTELGGSGMAGAVHRIMTSTFHLDFLSNFNYSGRINYNTTERKQSFAKLKVCSLIIGAVQSQSFPEGITNHQVEQCITKYLQNNNDKRRKMAKRATAVDARP